MNSKKKATTGLKKKLTANRLFLFSLDGRKKMYSELKNKLSEAFEANKTLFADSVIGRKREEAFTYFSALDFPTRKHEEWKYDNIKFLGNDFDIVMQKPENKIRSSELDKFLFNGLRDNMLVFVNGFLSKELSDIISDEITIESFSDAVKNHPELIEKHFGGITKDKEEIFTALNTAMAVDGAFIHIPDNVRINEKIQLIFITDATESNVFIQPRNLIIAGKNSEARFVQTCYTIGANIGVTNLVTEIFMGDDTLIGFYKVHNCRGNSYYIGTTEVVQGGKSTFNNASISLKGKFQRNNITTKFLDEHAEANLYGFYLMDGEDFVDNRTLIDHAVPNCLSNENYKGILDNKGRAVFNGKILVREHAQKTEAYQSNKNILLSDEAEIDTKPQLEIYADDVKCKPWSYIRQYRQGTDVLP